MRLRWLMVLCLLPMALFAACGGDDDDDTGDDDNDGTATATEEVDTDDQSIFELAVGDCFNDVADAGSTQTEVPLVDCADPHDNEVYYEYEIEDGDFPGEDAILEEAADECGGDAFEDYVGVAYGDSVLEIFPIYPTAASWEAGDRIVYCAAYNAELEKLTGTIEGSNE